MGLSDAVGSSSSKWLSPNEKKAVRTFWSGTSSKCSGGWPNRAVQVGTAVSREGTAMPRWSILMNVKAGANLSDVVKALNALGANPMDLLAILQAMKAAGALHAELEVI